MDRDNSFNIKVLITNYSAPESKQINLELAENHRVARITENLAPVALTLIMEESGKPAHAEIAFKSQLDPFDTLLIFAETLASLEKGIPTKSIAEIRWGNASISKMILALSKRIDIGKLSDLSRQRGEEYLESFWEEFLNNKQLSPWKMYFFMKTSKIFGLYFPSDWPPQDREQPVALSVLPVDATGPEEELAFWQRFTRLFEQKGSKAVFLDRIDDFIRQLPVWEM